jgi:cob(I)alamin adenosyltransferase
VVKIYTRTGDTGTTSLFGGRKVGKDHERLEAYGTVDELNAYLGWFRSRTRHADLARRVESIQVALFDIGAHLATPPDAAKARAALPELREQAVTDLETAIDGLEEELTPLTAFILPGGTEDSALLHVARTVCRRAERATVRAAGDGAEPLPPAGLAYLNRLSDLLFVMARVVNRRNDRPETEWSPTQGGGK